MVARRRSSRASSRCRVGESGTRSGAAIAAPTRRCEGVHGGCGAARGHVAKYRDRRALRRLRVRRVCLLDALGQPNGHHLAGGPGVSRAQGARAQVIHLWGAQLLLDGNAFRFTHAFLPRRDIQGCKIVVSHWREARGACCLPYARITSFRCTLAMPASHAADTAVRAKCRDAALYFVGRRRFARLQTVKYWWRAPAGCPHCCVGHGLPSASVTAPLMGGARGLRWPAADQRQGLYSLCSAGVTLQGAPIGPSASLWPYADRHRHRVAAMSA